MTIVDLYRSICSNLSSETIVAIKNFLLMIKTQIGSHVKVVRSDNGT